MVRGLEFDVSEMALTTYLVAKAHGARFTAVPVFLVRGFHHGAIHHDPASDIRTPKALEGRRVGVSRGYTVTTGSGREPCSRRSTASTSTRSHGCCRVTNTWRPTVPRPTWSP
ncbi:hypothetical protein ACFQV4_29455 [Streptomyces thermocarboxydus]